MNKEQNTSANEDACLVISEQKLYQFSQTRLAQFPKQGLKGSSTGATVICAFLMGAADTFASDDEELQLTVTELLSLDDRACKHLIDTTRRLSNKYPFVKKIFQQGQQTSAAWQENADHTEETPLSQLLEQTKNLTLMDLKQQFVPEEEPATTRATVHKAVEKNPRLRRLLFILLVLIILVAANYITLAVL